MTSSSNTSDSEESGDNTDSSIDLLASSPEPETPERKEEVTRNNKSQSSSIISSSPPKKKIKRDEHSIDSEKRIQTKKAEGDATSFSSKTNNPAAAASITKVEIPINTSPELVDDQESKAEWYVRDKFVLVRRPVQKQQKHSPLKKAAAFDLDQTLLLWKCAGWPSKPEHYELWSSSVLSTFQDLSAQGYQVIIFTNQGGIRSAVQGKTAARVKGLINWIAKMSNIPLWAVTSTSTKSGYHKPSSHMWQILEDECSTEFDLSSSFYVGDSDGDGSSGDDYQKQAVDKIFAENVGKLRDETLKFHTPQEFFGESDASRRTALKQIEKYKSPPASSHEVRAALLGGYLQSPILVILCGVQGSGKSTFCKKLIEYATTHKNNSEPQWVHLSQDTINNGKPGKREAVEEAACNALKEKRSVVIDRMHLTPDQRSHFITLGHNMSIPVHIVMLSPSSDILMERVKNRTDHPGGVQGERGMQLTKLSLQNIVMPEYDEGEAVVVLVTCCTSKEAADALCLSYSAIGYSGTRSNSTKTTTQSYSFPLHSTTLQNQASTPTDGLPMVTLGTQKVGKRKAPSVVTLALKNGITSIDTAPTYNNEEQIGVALQAGKMNTGDNSFVIMKVPKRATTPEQVRDEFEQSLQKLGGRVDLVLLHWPCDLIEMDKLEAVWKEMEQIVGRGKCRYLGVCNFSVEALKVLLPLCKDVRPIVNQVERHPLLPQWELLDFCTSQGIILQAHTSLGGHGKEDLLQHPKILNIVKEQQQQQQLQKNQQVQNKDANVTTAAQVLWKWNLQHNVAIVSRCTTEEHIQEFSSLAKGNIEDLMPSQMKAIDSIGMDKKNQMRFVAPPFMYKAGAIYAWGDRAPTITRVNK